MTPYSSAPACVGLENSTIGPTEVHTFCGESWALGIHLRRCAVWKILSAFMRGCFLCSRLFPGCLFYHLKSLLLDISLKRASMLPWNLSLTAMSLLVTMYFDIITQTLRVFQLVLWDFILDQPEKCQLHRDRWIKSEHKRQNIDF